MVLKYPNLKDHIFEYDLLSHQECDEIVSHLDSREWGDFMWYQDHEQVDLDKESKMKSTTNCPEASEIIQPHINDELHHDFHEKYNYSIQSTLCISKYNFCSDSYIYFRKHFFRFKMTE